MNSPKLAILLASFALTIGGASAAVPYNAHQAQSQESKAKQELTVTVVSVDMEHKTIQIKEAPGTISVTADTMFDKEVELSKLKPGMKVKVVGVSTPDGKVQALEVHTA